MTRMTRVEYEAKRNDYMQILWRAECVCDILVDSAQAKIQKALEEKKGIQEKYRAMFDAIYKEFWGDALEDIELEEDEE